MLKKILFFAVAITLGLSFFVPQGTLAASRGTYAYQWIRQSEYPTNMAPGSTTTVWVEVKNTGTATWKGASTTMTSAADFTGVVRLGTGSNTFGGANQKQDYASEVYDQSSWQAANRVTIFHRHCVTRTMTSFCLRDTILVSLSQSKRQQPRVLTEHILPRLLKALLG